MRFIMNRANMKSWRILSSILVLVMLTTLVSGTKAFAGEIEETIEIPSYITKTTIDGVEYLEFDSGEDMAWLRQHVMNKEDGGTAGAYYCTHNIILTNDIDMADYNATDGVNNGAWSGIGHGQQWIGYSGIFNGNGHMIYNIDVYTDQAVGPKGLLFNITKDATIKNLAVKGKVTSNRYIGGLVGRTTGSLTLENVVVDAELALSQGNANAIGGLIGQCGSGQTVGGSKITIKNCMAVGNYGSKTSSNPVGGMIGHVYGGYDVSIDNSYAAANLECDGGDIAGLIAGNGTATLKISNTYYLESMADTSLIVMTANGDPSPVGPESMFVNATSVAENDLKSADFIESKLKNFKADSTSGLQIGNGYPIPNEVNSIQAAFEGFACIGEPKTAYQVGEYFDLAGAYFVAKYSGGYNLYADYVINNTEPLTVDDKTIVVSLSRGSETGSQEFSITVEDIQRIEIQTPPKKTSYVENQKFNQKGMVVVAYDSQGNSKEIIPIHLMEL